AVEPIGQGGFGRTFKAIDEDKPSKPFCVIKQFFPQVEGTTATQKAGELFTQEASALEQLDYPNIPKLLAYFITADGRQYLVQEFIDGRNLKLELASQGTFSATQIRELLKSILPTLNYLHQLGFIHRDIKPENIIRRTDNSQLYLVDFGAAKTNAVTGADRKSQLQGTTIGTPEFMAPEQGWGRAFASSDLYSLGVTCINLWTGVSPFNLFDDDRSQWNWQDKIAVAIDPQLAIIIDKLIQPRPIDRYPTAQAVIDELVDRNVANLPVQNNDLPEPKILENTAALPTRVAPSPTPASSIKQFDLGLLNELGIPPQPISNSSIQPTANWTCDYTFTWHSKPINAIEIFTNGQYLISGDDGGTVAVWNLTMPQQPIATYCTNNAIYAVAASPNYSQMASGDKNRRVQLRRKESIINSLQELHADFSSVDSHHGFVYSVQFSPDGKILASSSADRRIRLWNTDTGKISYTLDGHQESVMALAFMPNGKILASAGADRTIRFWDVERKQLLKTIEAHSHTIHALAISRNGSLIVTGSTDRTVQVRQLGTSAHQTLEGHQDGVLTVAISPDNQTIASGSMDGMVCLWDANTKQLIQSFQAHQSAVRSIGFQINSKFLITASWDRTIKIWRSDRA
ncbi:serine/threonine-protein kinase, partial [Chamaesiphon sp. OTE_8_metabat_110]|uniref:serine/threonine-protein kinase n=1 Tax=Chamaesiphon sp. OTE_8_metabat_110 TaxID=2964696 RepID=UPI00286AF523